MPVVLTSIGNRPWAVATRFCISTAALSIFLPTSKVTMMLLTPSLPLVEDIYLMPCTPLICCSNGIVTLDSTASAFAPTYVHETVTCGGVICGYCSIGKLGIAIAPARMITSEHTAAKIGRLMKKSRNIAEPSELTHDLVFNISFFD